MDEAGVRKILDTIPDPEIPVISITELGVVRGIAIQGDSVTITITPTYTGCPAMKQFEDDIVFALENAGWQSVTIKRTYNPAWTTDWISNEAREKLRAYGIAPPMGKSTDKNVLLGVIKDVPCPQCHSTNTKMISQFGSTACKSLHQCNDCLETFDYFKCI